MRRLLLRRKLIRGSTGVLLDNIFARLPTGTCDGNPPAFSVRQKWSYAAIANFIAGVIPPSAMLGRSWLYVHSQRVALS